MRLRIAWGHPAFATFYTLHLKQAEAVDRAVIRFAETGEGNLEREPPYYRLRTGTHDALLAIDYEARMMTVLRILRAR